MLREQQGRRGRWQRRMSPGWRKTGLLSSPSLSSGRNDQQLRSSCGENPRNDSCVAMLIRSNHFSAEQPNKYDDPINLCASTPTAVFNLESGARARTARGEGRLCFQGKEHIPACRPARERGVLRVGAPSLCLVLRVTVLESSGGDDTNKTHSSLPMCQTLRPRMLHAVSHDTFLFF